MVELNTTQYYIQDYTGRRICQDEGYNKYYLDKKSKYCLWNNKDAAQGFANKYEDIWGMDRGELTVKAFTNVKAQ